MSTEEREEIDKLLKQVARKPRKKAKATQNATLENYDCNDPDSMVFEAMLNDEVIMTSDDGNGGMLDYIKKVAKLIKEKKDEQYRKIEQL